MAYKLQIHEILDKLKDITGEGSVARKVEWLRLNDSPTLRMILKHGFDPDIAYNLPEGDPPFKRQPENLPVDHAETTLFAETRKLSYLWLTASNDALKNLTESQKTQFDAAVAVQTDKGAAYKAALEADKAAVEAIEHAQMAIEEAKAKLDAALIARQQTGLAAQRARLEAEAADQYVARIRAALEQTHAQMTGQAPPPQVNPNIPKYQLEMKFIQILEALHPKEADVLLAAKNKRLTKQFAINKDIVKKAFPDLI